MLGKVIYTPKVSLWDKVNGRARRRDDRVLLLCPNRLGSFVCDSHGGVVSMVVVGALVPVGVSVIILFRVGEEVIFLPRSIFIFFNLGVKLGGHSMNWW